MVAAVASALMISGVQGGDVGVICPYRAQIAAVEPQLQEYGCGGVEVHTVDRFQGRDKHVRFIPLHSKTVFTAPLPRVTCGPSQVIIVSLVRSNSAHELGNLLKDWRRLNGNEAEAE